MLSLEGIWDYYFCNSLCHLFLNKKFDYNPTLSENKMLIGKSDSIGIQAIKQALVNHFRDLTSVTQ
jgi:hypothetical protein